MIVQIKDIWRYAALALAMLVLLCLGLGEDLQLEGKANGNELAKGLPLVLPEARTAEYRRAVEEVVLPYSRLKILDPLQNRGMIRVVQKGENGLLIQTYLVRYEDGVEKDRQVIASIVGKEPVPEITALGTGATKMVVSRSVINTREVLSVMATAYTHTGNRTFTGKYPQVGTIAVDPRVIPLGSRLWVEGYGYGVAQDTGSSIKGKRVDLFMESGLECRLWGRRQVRVYILE